MSYVYLESKYNEFFVDDEAYAHVNVKGHS